MEELPLYLIPIRVYISDGRGHSEELERFASPNVPRVGDYYNVQAWDLEIYRVSWISIDNRANVNIYLDGDKFFEWLNTSNKTFKNYLKLRHSK